jgi:hypothetical protein
MLEAMLLAMMAIAARSWGVLAQQITANVRWPSSDVISIASSENRPQKQLLQIV